MKFRIVTGVMSLGLLAGLSYGQEGSKNDITVSALGVFQKGTTGNGVDQTSTNNAGVLFTYRYFFTAHQGVELDYGFTRFDQQFSGAALASSFAVPTNTHEATASYVYRFGLGHRLTPFVSAGTGAFVFMPNNAFSVNGAGSNAFATPDFVYSAGADIALSRRVSLRLGYRGHVLEAPNFGFSALNTGNVTHIAEPFGGLTFHF